MASPQRRPTAETGYSSGRFLKLNNKSKTRIIFFHFFSCIPPAGCPMSQYLEPLATPAAQFTDWPRGKSAIFRFGILIVDCPTHTQPTCFAHFDLLYSSAVLHNLVPTPYKYQHDWDVFVFNFHPLLVLGPLHSTAHSCQGDPPWRREKGNINFFYHWNSTNPQKFPDHWYFYKVVFSNQLTDYNPLVPRLMSCPPVWISNVRW